jgi:exodeoxyribonuclease VII small subunit
VADQDDQPSPTARADSTDLPTTYEAAREELVEVVRRLESGGATLEESLALWERGEALATRCQQWLDGARERLDAAAAATQSTDRPPG